MYSFHIGWNGYKYDWYAKEPDALTEMHRVLCIGYRLGLFHHYKDYHYQLESKLITAWNMYLSQCFFKIGQNSLTSLKLSSPASDFRSCRRLFRMTFSNFADKQPLTMEQKLPHILLKQQWSIYMSVIVLCLLTSNKNRIFCLPVSNKSIDWQKTLCNPSHIIALLTWYAPQGRI